MPTPQLITTLSSCITKTLTWSSLKVVSASRFIHVSAVGASSCLIDRSFELNSELHDSDWARSSFRYSLHHPCVKADLMSL